MSQSRSRQHARRIRRRDKRNAEHQHRSHALWQSEKQIDEPVIHVLSYEITEDAMAEPAHGGTRIADVLDGDARQDLFERAQNDPQSVIARLCELIERHPDIPVLYNWLTVAYCAAEDDESAEQTAKLLYERHPQYLFGRLHLAQCALRAGDILRFEELFDRKFDLKLLYPWRNIFHISEYLNFSSLLVEYYLRTERAEAAEMILDVMEKVAPDAPQTRRAQGVLEHVGLLQLLKTTIDGLSRGRRTRRRKTSANIIPPAQNEPTP